MRMLKTVMIFFGFMIFVVGCSSKSELGEGARSIEDSALEANNLVNAPSWVLNGGKEGLSSIGSAEITKAGLQFARNEALAMARDELGRIISVKVEGLVNNAVQQTIGNNSYDSVVEKYGEQVTRQIVSQTMVGTKQKDTWITPDGKQIYVLVELDSNLADKAKKSIMQNVAQNNNIPLEKEKFLNALDQALDTDL